SDEGLHAISEIMIGAGDLAEINFDLALMRQLGYKLLHGFDRHYRILVTLQDQTRGWARGEKREVVQIGRRRYRYKAFDFRSPHQQLHASHTTHRRNPKP